MALSESKTFYKKAWDNLQAVSQDSASPAAGTPSDIPVITGNSDSVTPPEKKDDGDKDKKKDDAKD